MKKILSLILSILMIFSLCALTACGEQATEENKAEESKPEEKPAEAATLKFGAGASGKLSTAEATDTDPAEGSVDASYAAVLVDADGKIVAVELDAMKITNTFADGKVTAAPDKDMKSKYEQKEEYEMSKIGKTEWYKQADALEKMIVGKTLDEVKALVVEGYKPNADVQAAGCTISIGDLIKAVENAYNNATTEVSADATLSIAGAGTQAPKDADGDAEAQTKIEAYLSAAAKDKDGKILAITTDCMHGNFALNAEGKVYIDETQCDPARTKRQQGNDYGMSKQGKTEWDKQVDAFDAACIGKTAAEIAGLMGEDYKGIADVQTAGCTIYVSGLVSVISKL